MTTPNPSRSVSPEPTKGEEAAWRAWFDAVMADPSPPRTNRQAFEGGFEAALEAYTPLVEAAEAFLAEFVKDEAITTTDWGITFSDKFTIAAEALKAALVQVPGQQQQAEQDGVGGSR